MTRENAVSLLRQYRRSEGRITSGVCRTERYSFGRPAYETLKRAYLGVAVDELIRRIEHIAWKDPIDVVQDFYYEMDDILSASDDDHFLTHAFASHMENIACELLTELREKEEHA